MADRSQTPGCGCVEAATGLFGAIALMAAVSVVMPHWQIATLAMAPYWIGVPLVAAIAGKLIGMRGS